MLYRQWFWRAHERPTLGLPDPSDSRGAAKRRSRVLPAEGSPRSGRARSAIGGLASGTHTAGTASCSSGQQREVRPHRILNSRIHVRPILALHGLDDRAAFLLNAAEAFGEVAH